MSRTGIVFWYQITALASIQRAKQALDAANRMARKLAKDAMDKMKEYSKVFDRGHLRAARQELEGKVVKISPRTGKPYDHVKDVMDNWRGLNNRIEDLRNALTREMGTEERNLLQKQLDKCTQMDKFLRGVFKTAPGGGK